MTEFKKIPETRDYYCDSTGLVYRLKDGRYSPLGVTNIGKYERVYFNNKSGKTIHRSRQALAKQVFEGASVGEHSSHTKKFDPETIRQVYATSQSAAQAAQQLGCNIITIYRNIK